MIRMIPVKEPEVLDSLVQGRFSGEVRGYVIMDGPEYRGHCLFTVEPGCTRVLEVQVSDPSLLDGAVRADDIVETANHFKCVDMIVENASRPLSEAFVKELHRTLKNGTSDARKEWFAVGAYKRLPNTVGDAPTAPPEEVPARMKAFVDDCNTREELSFDDLLDLHHRFELIHPFQDGNGRVGRLLLFRECLRRGIVPFIIDDDLKYYYYRGLKEWGRDRAYLRDTCLAAQDAFKRLLDHFKIEY